MRFSKPKQGTERVRSGFLWFPKKMLNVDRQAEIRWLERAKWIEMFIEDGSWGSWLTMHWIDDA